MTGTGKGPMAARVQWGGRGDWAEHTGFQGRDTTVCDTIMMDPCPSHLAKQETTPRTGNIRSQA